MLAGIKDLKLIENQKKCSNSSLITQGLKFCRIVGILRFVSTEICIYWSNTDNDSHNNQQSVLFVVSLCDCFQGPATSFYCDFRPGDKKSLAMQINKNIT